MQIEAKLDLADRGPDFPILPTCHNFQVQFCADPMCGPHLVLRDKSHKPFCEMVLSREQVSELYHRTFKGHRP